MGILVDKVKGREGSVLLLLLWGFLSTCAYIPVPITLPSLAFSLLIRFVSFVPSASPVTGSDIYEISGITFPFTFFFICPQNMPLTLERVDITHHEAFSQCRDLPEVLMTL